MNRGTCIHFNGLRYIGAEYRTHCCSAGVNYHSTFDGTKAGIMLRMPCVEAREKSADGKPGTHFKAGQETVLVPVDRKDEVAIPCLLRVEPTADQVKQDREESDRQWIKMIAALRTVSTWKVKPKPDQDRSEVVDCPVCKGRLHLHQSSYNGHASGKCETAGCVEFVE
jgi:hypothetical protein